MIPEITNEIRPYFCLGFIIQDAVVYLSDVSHIPEDVWSLFKRSADDDRRSPVPPVFVLDCLRLQSHTSHLGLADAVEVARRMGAQRTYLTGFGHEVSHEEYVTIGEVLGGKQKEKERLTSVERQGLQLIEAGEDLWLRPAFDGLRVFVSEDLTVRDEEYH